MEEGLSPTQLKQRATEAMDELHDLMLGIFGRGDGDMRQLNKLLRELITI